MNFCSVRIITANFTELVDFYAKVTGVPAMRYTDDFAEVRTPKATLAIGSVRTLGFFGGPGIASPAGNRSAIIEFHVNDVDAIFADLEGFLGNAVVQKPVTMPWGNRSLLFRDPDGNLVNFFTPVTPEARKRFEGDC